MRQILQNPKFGSRVEIVLHPHPQYGGTMNNRIVQLMYNIFLKIVFCYQVNFGELVKGWCICYGQGEFQIFGSFRLDKRQNLDYSQCWVSGFSFSSLICIS